MLTIALTGVLAGVDWNIDWSVGWRKDWNIDWSIYGIMDWSVDCSIDWNIDFRVLNGVLAGKYCLLTILALTSWSAGWNFNPFLSTLCGQYSSQHSSQYFIIQLLLFHIICVFSFGEIGLFL